MTITDQLRKRLNDYQFENRLNLKDFHAEMTKEYKISYDGLRQFWRADTEGSGSTINALDNFLKDRGY